MKKSLHILAVFVCGCIAASCVTSCRRDSELYNALSASSENASAEVSATDPTEHVINTDDTRIAVDPFDDIRNAASDITSFGDSASFLDPETSLEHSVRVLSVSYGTSLNEIGIEASSMKDYLFEAGFIGSDGTALQGRKYMVITCEITKTHSISSDIPDNDPRNHFSLTNSCILNSRLEPCDAMMAGFVQPSESQMPDRKSMFFIRIPSEGMTIECKAVYLIKADEEPAVLSVTLFDPKLLSLNG